MQTELIQIITQKTDGRELDYDPNEGKDWNWEDYV